LDRGETWVGGTNRAGTKGSGVQAIADWKGRLTAAMRIALLVAAIASPVASHIALLTGHGVRVAVALGVLQAVAIGVVIAGIGGAGRHRRLALLASAAMLGVLALGVAYSPALGLRLAAGTSHALLYATLFVVFAATLLPGHTDVVTRVAQRLNPRFHTGMRSYTRRVTIAWCVFFAGQIVVSALLLRFAPARWWLLFVNGLNVPLVVLMFLAEYAIRRRRFPGGQSTDLATMVRGFRRSRAAPGRHDAGAPGQAAAPHKQER
jgi:uncharacterized membrane protein